MPIYPYSFQLPPLNVQDIPNDGAVGEFLGISAGGVLDWLPISGGGGGDLLAANNLSELTATAGTARTNLGLGTGDSPTFKNLVISTGTIATSAPVTISQTWSTTGTYTAAKIDVTETATANTASRLLDLQVGGVSKAYVGKDGAIYGTGTVSGGVFKTWMNLSGYYQVDRPSTGVIFGGYPGQFMLPSSSFMGWNSGEAISAAVDVKLFRDAANTLALRNSTAAQTFNVYGTYTSGSAYARLAIACDTSGNATLTTQSTGTAGTVSINGVPVGLGKGGSAFNVAVGTNALAANTTGAYIVAVGNGALQSNTTGNSSTAVGLSALAANTTGGFNSAFGLASLNQNSSGGFNTALGAYALESNSTGGNNVGIGYYSLRRNTTGSNNLAIGYQAGYYITGGATDNALANNSLFLGANTKANASNETNQIVIGYDATGLGSNTAVLGNASITTTALRGNVGIGTTAPSSKLHVVGNSSPSITIDNTLATGASQLLFKNTVVTGDTDGVFLNGSTQTGLGGAGSLNIKATTGPIAFHTATVTNAFSMAQTGATNFSQAATFNNDIYGQRDVYCGNNRYFRFANATALSSNAVGVMLLSDLTAVNLDPRMAFGGTTASFPALKRSSTTLQVRLADDNAFAPIQGKLTTDTAFTSGAITDTGYIVLYDSTGAAYKVACTPV